MKTYTITFEIPHTKLEMIVGLLSGEIDHFNVREKDAPHTEKKQSSSQYTNWMRPLRQKLKDLLDAKPEKDFAYNGPEITAALKAAGYKASVASSVVSLMTRSREVKRVRRGVYCSALRKDA